MSESYDLTKLNEHSFEHLVNMLALTVLGPGHTGFGPGPDGGRDGYFEGTAPYPSKTDRWSGCWYIQSKFHKPHLSINPQKWLIGQIKKELDEFDNEESKRIWPDNWIIATNIDPSGTPMTGAFDQARKLVSKVRPKLKDRFHIWGGRKILDFLVHNPAVVDYYRHYLTPGNILTALYDQIKDARAEIETIIHFLIVKQFEENKYTKLEQAGSTTDIRPGIHRLFVDVPFKAEVYDLEGMVVPFLVRTAARCHKIEAKQPDTKEWRHWQRHPSRARVWFVKGGPGQGKSTIGQYFCQILRAALILQKDGPTVLPEQKTLATEIKNHTKKNGFWPLVPRIPISIELKDYAQWFGQRNAKDARGILTYLAERLSVSVEQEVLAGTLKRALKSRSWFVVFDGLDEVPHDVKDKVASEIRNFIDHIALQCNADLFTLCTSRPQGYSGQFSKLDGPTIDLLNLSPEQALRCAKPVLELGRTKGEFEKSFQIIETAIESSSVQELMKTPLQCHIMAIVVRDGGRPPERRWQLFNNFYHVIKRREANRDLPDARLAKLLREEEQLLKTVHNRLGFVLHSRAETSKGAQTSLQRSEFKSLLEEAVAQMIEKDIESTVNVLMEATTERLVLVSTPDDGNHLRFDIRQLQEFFVAEFLYESINADALGRRLEIIAGDPHWREVIHFLMSSLIENGRRTELAIAVEVLERLNEGEEEPPLRLLNRRLGRGGLLTVRLLEEGVLEQDKRIRHHFRKCLEPLLAFTNFETLEPLINVTQPNSQAWLINFLVDSLREANHTENIGAATILPYVLPDAHERVQEVKNFLLLAPPLYISFVLNHNTPKYSGPSISQKDWFLDTTLKILLHEEWFLIGLSGIRSAITILSSDLEKTKKIGKKIGLSEIEIHLLIAFLHEDDSPLLHDEHYQGECGVFKLSYFEHDWTTNSYTFDGWTKELREETPNMTGILQLAYRILRYLQNKSLSNLLSILNFFDKEISLVDAIPRTLKAYMPINWNLPLKDQINYLNSLDEKQFEDLKQGKQTRGSVRVQKLWKGLEFGSKWTLNRWKTTIEELPDIAFHVWEEMLWDRRDRRPKILDQNNAVNALIDRLIVLPSILTKYPYLWGRLLKKAPKREVDLRKAFLAASKEPVSLSFAREFHSFKLDLPKEASLLPHLLSSLIAFGNHLLRRQELANTLEELSLIEELSQLVEQMTNDRAQLKEIAYDIGIANENRAAALLMYLLQKNGKKSLDENKELLIELYTRQISFWYLEAITLCITQLTTEEDPTAKWIVGNLLDADRANYEGRQELQRILTIWRESSYAPVHKASLQEKWLAGD